MITVLHKLQIIDEQGKQLTMEEAFMQLREVLESCRNCMKVIIIGNGGSAAIAAHTVNDLIRNCGIPALGLNEAAVLTCLSNDLSYAAVYEEQIQLLMQEGDVLIAISSSGKSENILRAVYQAKQKRCLVFTLSGFSTENPLRKLGKINIYIPSEHYGYVELSHQIFLHCLTDYIKEGGV